jgi:hypothetical protein
MVADVMLIQSLGGLTNLATTLPSRAVGNNLEANISALFFAV